MGRLTRHGVFGGTFDPIHIGHLVAADEARAALGLSKVIFAPAARPPHKEGEAVTGAYHRARMLELALARDDAMVASRVDLDRPGPHYTVEMLRLLATDLGRDSEIYLIMGTDSLVDLPTWREPAVLVHLAWPTVVTRPGYVPDLDALEDAIPGLRQRVRFVPTPLVGVSSSDIRQRVARGRPFRYLVPEGVAEYIRRHRLYAGAE